MKRLSLAILLSVTLSARATSDDLKLKAATFDLSWGAYIRELFGCDATGPTDADHCRPEREKIDYAAFRKAREAAKELFDLREK